MERVTHTLSDGHRLSYIKVRHFDSQGVMQVQRPEGGTIDGRRIGDPELHRILKQNGLWPA